MLRYVITALELAAVLAALVLLQQLDPKYAVWAALAVALLAILAFSSRVRIPRLDSRRKALALLGVCVVAMYLASGDVWKEREAELADLKKTDVAAYLVELKKLDEGRWLKEAKELDRVAYDKEMARLAEENERERRDPCSERQVGMAFIMMQPEVTRRLKSPTSAEFPSLEGKDSGLVGECVYWVHSYVDAANSFGAQLRTPFSGKIRHHPSDGTWQVLTLKIGK